jgi:amidophosphoribosyltransferase
MSQETPWDKLREECGVVGISGDLEAANLAMLGLHALQHRGQEGAGIVSSDQSRFHSYRGLGLVGEVFTASAIDSLKGTMAIGHVRYSTTGGNTLRNVQPLSARYRYGQVAIAHNGNLVNASELRQALEERGSIFNTSSDTEVILHLIATSQKTTFVNRLVEALSQVKGSYSLLLLTEEMMIAVRDPMGIRPLVMGRRGDAHVFASESCALDLLGGETEREVEPGEMVIVSRNGVTSLMPFGAQPRKACIFEHVYFSRPNSVTYGESVFERRFGMGRALAEEEPVEADCVIAVPDSGTAAALGYAEASGIGFRQGLIRSHYVGRTFIEPSQKIRDFGVKLKLSPVESVIRGKRVVVVDDSLVRGTTSKKIVRMLRKAGAVQVHMRICSPPIVSSCFYGVDTPTREELIAYTKTLQEIKEYLEADSLSYLGLEAMHGVMDRPREAYCNACFSGDYPIAIDQAQMEHQLDLFFSEESEADSAS